MKAAAALPAAEPKAATLVVLSMKTPLTLAFACALTLGACSSPKKNDTASQPATDAAASETAPGSATVPAIAAQDSATEAATPNAPSRVLGLEGLGTLLIGQPVPRSGGWAERGAQESDSCRTVTSPEYPGVYAIVEGGKVRRITVGRPSGVKLVEGIGVGASEKEVTGAFAGFRSEPHKYEAAPARYLTAPNAASGGPALRFEIGTDRKVSAIHVGTMPTLGYIEGCS